MEDTYNKIAFRYAKALFLHAEENSVLDPVLNDLELIYNVLINHEDLKEVISNVLISSKKKEAILTDIFEKKVSKTSFNFLHFLTYKKRLSLLIDIYICYRNLYYDAQNMLQAHVTSAMPIQENQQKAIIETLEQKFSKKVIPIFQVNDELIAGFKINILDRVMDLSVQTKLQSLKAT